MIYAIVVDGAVANIAVAKYPVKDNWIATDGADVQIGDTYDGQTFSRNEENLLTEEELRTQNADMQAALELLGVVVDG